MKTTAVKKRNMFGRDSGYYTCTLGDTGWSADGRSKEEAENELRVMLTHDWACRYGVKYIRVPGATFCLRHEPGGWVYDIVRDISPELASSCQMGEVGQTKAFEAMAAHAKDYTP